MMVGFLIDMSAEQGQNGILENQIDGGENQAYQNAEYDGTADTFMCIFFFVCAQTDADKCAAAVTDHNSKGKGDYRKRIDDCVGGISVRAEVAGICDKNLIHNVVECSDQK